MKNYISGWGRNIFSIANISYPKNLKQLKKKIKKDCIARGLGRSYGDSSIQPKNTIITTGLNRIIFFDEKRGIIELESGVSISSLLNVIVHKGWFLPVTPGSKKITIGGMIASDVHGKNHHKVGSFGNYILDLKLINNEKKLIYCSKKKNDKIFKFTIGGMGLTGIIYSCRIKLKKINSPYIITETIKNFNLKETIRSIQKSKNWEYNVAWIDTSPNKNQLGRSILTRGYFSKKKHHNFYFYKKKPFINYLPNFFPSWFMNNFLIKFLNDVYFKFSSSSKKILHIDDFFYPLDKVNNWNVAYGKKGFISYQCSIPQIKAFKTIYKILEVIKENKIYSFVSVLKSMKKKKYQLSFGQDGYTLVFDFPIYPNIYETLNSIDFIVKKNKGKIYLTKDSRIKNKIFNKINGEFNQTNFRNFRKKINYYFSSLQSERLGL
jgi:decaprenylphospho-beta-D-ribofuranose 2-oxidase